MYISKIRFHDNPINNINYDVTNTICDIWKAVRDIMNCICDMRN